MGLYGIRRTKVLDGNLARKEITLWDVLKGDYLGRNAHGVLEMWDSVVVAEGL